MVIDVGTGQNDQLSQAAVAQRGREIIDHWVSVDFLLGHQFAAVSLKDAAVTAAGRARFGPL